VKLNPKRWVRFGRKYRHSPLGRGDNECACDGDGDGENFKLQTPMRTQHSTAYKEQSIDHFKRVTHRSHAHRVTKREWRVTRTEDQFVFFQCFM